MVDRMIRAARGDVALYEEAEANSSLTTEAYTIVGIVAVISAVGGLILAGVTGTENAVFGAIYSLVSTLAGYFIWAYLTYFIGTRVFNGKADFGELQRTLGYAYSPLVLSFIPCVGLIASLWSIYLGIVAVRQALDFDTGKAVLTAGIAFVVQFVIFAVIGTALGLGAAGLGAITG